MSESSEERTKRKYIQYLHACEWKYQYSIFYASYAACKEATTHSHKLKRNISRAFPVPLLHRLSLKRGLHPKIFDDLTGTKKVVAAWHSFLSVDELDKAKVKKIAEHIIKQEVVVKGRAISDEKLEEIERAIKKQKPHNLKSFFRKSNIQRISFLNKTKGVVDA